MEVNLNYILKTELDGARSVEFNLAILKIVL